MATTLNSDPFDKGNCLEDDLCDLSVSPPPPQDLLISSTPVPPLKRKQDFPDPVPKRKPTLSPDKENHDPDKTPTRPDTSVSCRLPEPCLLPNTFSRKTTDAIERGDLLGTAKTRMLREAATFYFGVCSGRCSSDYITIAKTLCKEYPQLRDKMPTNGEYWVSCLLQCRINPQLQLIACVSYSFPENCEGLHESKVLKLAPEIRTSTY